MHSSIWLRNYELIVEFHVNDSVKRGRLRFYRILNSGPNLLEEWKTSGCSLLRGHMAVLMVSEFLYFLRGSRLGREGGRERTSLMTDAHYVHSLLCLIMKPLAACV